MEKWLLDTDLGCDSDDCMALGLILANKDIELMGITTVSGYPFKRAKFAKEICKHSRKDIPIHCGNEYSLDGRIQQSYLIEGAMEVADSNTDNDLTDKNTAVPFMKKIIEENPNQITLVAIGQMTNIALLFSVYPHIPKLLKSLLIMGGRYFERDHCDVNKWGTTEWNIKCDNYAATIVFGADIKECYVVGVEETCKCNKPALEIKNKLSNIPYMKPVVKSLKYHPDDFPVWFHDAILVWGYINKDNIKLVKGNITVEILGDNEAKTILHEDENGRHYVMVDINGEDFFEYYANQMGFEWDK